VAFPLADTLNAWEDGCRSLGNTDYSSNAHEITVNRICEENSNTGLIQSLRPTQVIRFFRQMHVVDPRIGLDRPPSLK